MEFWAAVQVIRKRWYVVVACGLVFGGLAVAVARQIRPSYQTSGQVLVVQTETPPANSNASNNFGTTAQFANDLASLAAGESFANQVAQEGGSSTYTVTPSFSNTSLLLVSATAAAPDGALGTYKAVRDALDRGIDQLQSTINLSPGTRYGTLQLVPASRPVPLVGSRIKALIALGLVALLVTLGLVFASDSWFNARDRRRAERKLLAESTPSPATSHGIRTLNQFVALNVDDAEALDMDPDGPPSGRQLRWIQDDQPRGPGSEATGS